MRKTKQIHFRVTPAEARRLDELTRLTGHTRGTLLRHLLRSAEAALLQVRPTCIHQDTGPCRKPAPGAGRKEYELDS